MNYTNEYVRADLAQAPAPVRVGCPYGASDADCCGGFCDMERADDGLVQKMHKSAALEAPAPALWTQAQQLDFARAYDTEDAAQRGEPTPWVDGEDTGEWVDERVACVRAGLAALDTPDAHPTNMQKVHNAPDAGVAELVEALELTTARLAEIFQDADTSKADPGYPAAINRILERNRAALAKWDAK